MREGELTYDDFLRRLNIQDVLIDAGYHLNRRDGLRYPSYVRLDSEGRRIRNDKFIVTQQGKCCFKPQQQKSYNIISFIKEHPHFFGGLRHSPVQSAGSGDTKEVLSVLQASGHRPLHAVCLSSELLSGDEAS